MRIDTRIGLTKKDIVIEEKLEPALENLWNNEAFRGQVLQVAIQALSDQGFSADEIEWKMDNSGYVLLMIVGKALEGLTQQAIKQKVIPFIKEKVNNHRDFTPTS